MQIIVANKYKIEKKIDQGSFGQIYLAINIKNGQYVAIKFQNVINKYPQLHLESKILTYLLNDSTVTDKGLPNIYYTGIQGQYNVMVMDYLGQSLQKLFNNLNKRLTLKTTLIVADQILKRIQYIHNKKILHRDIKPDNFLIGRAKKDKKIYLIDFGLAKQYIKNGQHIPYSEGKKLVGTVRYASLNTHLGIQPTRRDDLQSLVYCICYFLLGQLPWQNQKAKSQKQKFEKIMQKKMQYRPQLLCKKLPIQILNFFNQVRSLKYDQKPNYQLLKNLLRQCLANNNLQYDYYFDWDKDNDQKNKYTQKK